MWPCQIKERTFGIKQAKRNLSENIEKIDIEKVLFKIEIYYYKEYFEVELSNQEKNKLKNIFIGNYINYGLANLMLPISKAAYSATGILEDVFYPVDANVRALGSYAEYLIEEKGLKTKLEKHELVLYKVKDGFNSTVRLTVSAISLHNIIAAINRIIIFLKKSNNVPSMIGCYNKLLDFFKNKLENGYDICVMNLQIDLFEDFNLTLALSRKLKGKLIAKSHVSVMDLLGTEFFTYAEKEVIRKACQNSKVYLIEWRRFKEDFLEFANEEEEKLCSEINLEIALKVAFASAFLASDFFGQDLKYHIVDSIRNSGRYPDALRRFHIKAQEYYIRTKKYNGRLRISDFKKGIISKDQAILLPEIIKSSVLNVFYTTMISEKDVILDAIIMMLDSNRDKITIETDLSEPKADSANKSGFVSKLKIQIRQLEEDVFYIAFELIADWEEENLKKTFINLGFNRHEAEFLVHIIVEYYDTVSVFYSDQ